MGYSGRPLWAICVVQAVQSVTAAAVTSTSVTAFLVGAITSWAGFSLQEWWSGPADYGPSDSIGGSMAALGYVLRGSFPEEWFGVWGQLLHGLILGVGCILGCFFSFLLAVLAWMLANARSVDSPPGPEYIGEDFAPESWSDSDPGDEIPLQTVSRMSSGRSRRHRSGRS